MSIPKLITAPSVEPVTLADVKEQISFGDSLQDVVLVNHIKEARQYCEEYLNRALITQTLEMAFDSFPSDLFFDAFKLKKMPIQSIESVKYLDTDGVEQTLDSDQYVLDDYSAWHSLMPAYAVSWPSTQDSALAVKIRYVAGYGDAGSDVPSPLLQAIKLIVGHWVRYLPVAESGVTITRVPFAAENLMDNYRVNPIT